MSATIQLRASVSLLLLFFLLLTGALFLPPLNDPAPRPVIGIYTEPSKYSSYPSSQYSFIAVSYAHYLESAGAQVVPIFYDADKAYYDEIFTQIDGILFPGGDVELVPTNVFTTNAAYLIQKALDANDRGEYFPIWGTCLGWELLNVVISGYEEGVLANVTHEQMKTHPIHIVKDGAVFERMPEYLKDVSETQPLWFFNHQQCVTQQTYKDYPKLGAFFEVLALAHNDLGDVFIAAGQGKKYPVYGTQFHPEKNNFEWRVPANHDLNAVLGSQYLANFFVSECRRSQNSFVDNAALQSRLIYNYPTAIIPPEECPYSQVYILPNWSSLQ